MATKSKIKPENLRHECDRIKLISNANARVNIWQEELNFLRILRGNLSLSLDSVNTKINLVERLIRIEKESVDSKGNKK